MKHSKKIASLFLALVMALALAVPAFADETTYSITINNSTEGHTYEAYQIFTGDLYEGTLSNIKWGSGVSAAGQTALGDAAEKAETIKTADDAAAFAKEVAGYLGTVAGSANAVTDGKYVISGLAAGYYLIKDQEGSLTGDHDSYTSYILEVVKNVGVDPKNTGTPEVVKKVQDINDSEDSSITDNAWQDSADHDIGDKVPFQLTATLADNVSSYTTYKVVFHDTLSEGLTYNNDAKVTFNSTDVTSYFTINEENGSLTISCNNVKKFGATNNSVITVEYTATLNSNAVIGSAGNPNKVYLEYSNNPNKSAEGDNETGKTPEDTVIVFTYKTIINKVTKNPDYDPEVEGSKEYIPLTGAEFTLQKKQADGTYKDIAVVKNAEGTTFTFSGLDDGEYKLVETTTPSGYNDIDDIEFEIIATHTNGDTPVLENLNGNKISGEITFASNTTDGSLSANVINNKGAELPSTVGMGTTIFYVVGSILVLAAVVLLVTKKRMSGEK